MLESGTALKVTAGSKANTRHTSITLPIILPSHATSGSSAAQAVWTILEIPSWTSVK
jgi:hypothetical protein